MPRENLQEMKRKLIDTLSAIGAPPRVQLAYLREIGFRSGREIVDELAQELNDYDGLVGDLLAADLLSADAAASTTHFLEWLKRPELRDVWDREMLDDARWDEIRLRAQRVLELISGAA